MFLVAAFQNLKLGEINMFKSEYLNKVYAKVEERNAGEN